MAAHTPMEAGLLGALIESLEKGTFCPHGRDVEGCERCRDAIVAALRRARTAPELLACLRRMCGMYGAYSKRLAPLLAEDEGTIWTFERANGLALEAIAKAEGR